MPLDPVDYDLSMKISRRGTASNPEDLRSLLIHRLTGAAKAVLRRPLKSTLGLSIYCEKCGRWQKLNDVPYLWTCNGCDSRFRVELVIYEEIYD